MERVAICKCGCGKPTKIHTKTNIRRGFVKGQFTEYLPRHRAKAEWATSRTGRFWSKVVKGDGCWIWTGDANELGYGRFENRKAHRVAWELEFGAIPDGGGTSRLCVLHKCDNPSCVRPDHLFLGTQKDNMKDMSNKGRAGSRYGESNKTSKLTAPDVVEIRAMAAKGQTFASIGRRFQIDETHAKRIVRREAWQHI